jgi:hypothetical protein
MRIDLSGWIIRFCVTILLTACTDTKQSRDTIATVDTVTKQQDSILHRRDTIYGRDIEQDPLLPPGIRLDTNRTEGTKHHTGIYTVMPVMTSKEHRWLNSKLETFRKRAVREFEEQTKEDSVEEAYGYMHGWSMWIEPLSLYKTDSVISFILKTGSGHTGMPSGYWYPTFNFDNRKGREIRFADYFQLDTPADTNAWASIVGRASGASIEDTKRLLEIDDKIEFGFDKDNVYICIEKYHVFPFGVQTIKKSVFITSIRSAYR